MKINYGPSPGYIISVIFHSVSFYIALLIFTLKNWDLAVLTLQQYLPITETHLTFLTLLFLFWSFARSLYTFHFTTYSITNAEDNPVLEIGLPYAFFGQQINGIFCQLITDCDYRVTPLQTLFQSVTLIIESADNKKIRIPYTQKELLDKLRKLCPKIKVLGTI